MSLPWLFFPVQGRKNLAPTLIYNNGETNVLVIKVVYLKACSINMLLKLITIVELSNPLLNLALLS